MRTLFISDLHLSADDVETDRRFRAFIEGPARYAHKLYLLGDLFDQWLGDAQVTHDPYAARVAAHFRALSDTGCDIRMLVGNRDFMIGPRFVQACGATLLPGPSVEDIDGERILVLHGDELCTSDVGYQRARKILRHPLFKPAVAALPYRVRAMIAHQIRRKSAHHKEMLAQNIMDVTDAAVNLAFARAGVTCMIHGHTHRPTGATPHTHIVNGDACRRYVLDDWQGGTGYTQLENGSVSHHPWPD